jgi:hypothetical protein
VIPVISVLVVLTLSMVVIRIATVALVHTGLGLEAARFQARSAFTGAGYTTNEAEDIVGHPVRRRLVSWLMLAGNVGLVTAVSSLMLSLVDMRTADSGWVLLLVLVVGSVLLLVASSSDWVDRHVSRGISWVLNRVTEIDARDYARILHLREDYGVSDLLVQPGESRSPIDAGETERAIDHTPMRLPSRRGSRMTSARRPADESPRFGFSSRSSNLTVEAMEARIP